MTDKVEYFTVNQEKLARYGKALSHPVRVFILDYLANNLNKCCYSGDMAEELPIARSTLSEHLKELKKAGLIQGEINPPYQHSVNWGFMTELPSWNSKQKKRSGTVSTIRQHAPMR